MSRRPTPPRARDSDNSPLRALVLASKPARTSPSQRFRLEQWAPHLERKHNISLDLVPFESDELTQVLYRKGHTIKKASFVLRDFVRRSAAVRNAHDYDAVIVHREAALLGPAFYERLLAWMGRPLIFDFDDAIWLHQESRSGIFSRLKFPGKTATICRLASACTPGNEYLAEYARKRNPNTFVIPTSIDTEEYRVMPEPSEGEPFTVCWTGSTSTLQHFELARQPLEWLAAQIPVMVKVICNEPPHRPVAGAEMRFVRWSPEIEVQEIGNSHVGLMPLPDDEFARGKCGLKALQCMATGRPVVVSPVGVNSTIVRHEGNGFLASNIEDFVDSLLRLARSPDLRASMGRAARRTVEESYSAEVVAGRFAKVVRSVSSS